jgi:cytochrome c peroxidase
LGLTSSSGILDPGKATQAELRGQEIFFGKGRCGACHAAPYYTDNLMHDLKTERFFKPEMINGMNEVGDGAVKTFPLRGIKDSPPYLHDGRLLTLDGQHQEPANATSHSQSPASRSPPKRCSISLWRMNTGFSPRR